MVDWVVFEGPSVLVYLVCYSNKNGILYPNVMLLDVGEWVTSIWSYWHFIFTIWMKCFIGCSIWRNFVQFGHCAKRSLMDGIQWFNKAWQTLATRRWNANRSISFLPFLSYFFFIFEFQYYSICTSTKLFICLSFPSSLQLRHQTVQLVKDFHVSHAERVLNYWHCVPSR